MPLRRVSIPERVSLYLADPARCDQHDFAAFGRLIESLRTAATLPGRFVQGTPTAQVRVAPFGQHEAAFICYTPNPDPDGPEVVVIGCRHIST